MLKHNNEQHDVRVKRAESDMTFFAVSSLTSYL